MVRYQLHFPMMEGSSSAAAAGLGSEHLCCVYIGEGYVISRVYIGDVAHDYARNIALYVLSLATLGDATQIVYWK